MAEGHSRAEDPVDISPPGQVEMLFNEAEACASPVIPDPETEQITYTRRKTGKSRNAQLENLPTEEIDYELPVEEQICPQCAGDLHKMGVYTRQEIVSVKPSTPSIGINGGAILRVYI